MSLKAVFNNIVVKPQEEEETTYGSIVVPDLGKTKNLTGTIISVGPGYYSATGTFVPITLKVGQKVILPQMGPVSIEYEGETYWGCAENMIIGIIEE
jgi:chaperonin GroES